MNMKSQSRAWVGWAEMKNCAGMVGNFGVMGIFIDLTVVTALMYPHMPKFIKLYILKICSLCYANFAEINLFIKMECFD